MSLNDSGLGTLPESIVQAGEGDGLVGSPLQRTKSPREGPEGILGSCSFSCCTEQELFPFSMGLELIGVSPEATGFEILDPEPFDFVDFFRLLLAWRRFHMQILHSYSTTLQLSIR